MNKRRSACALALLALCVPASAAAQVAELDLGTTIFHEPSPTSKMTVITPHAALGVSPADWLTINAGYEADIVSGASEEVKAGPLVNVDVISSATEFTETRHVVNGGFSVNRKDTRLSASYSYGTESDYRSHAISVSAGTSFLQKNTEIELSYARGFDQVCTKAFASTIAPSARDPLEDSSGCFTGDADRAARDIALDNFQAAWTQTWTPVLATQLSLSGSMQHGFLGNPYRTVVISSSQLAALENHPEDRARAAVALRAKYFVRPIDTAFTVGVRGYRDTWDVLSQTYELEAERYMLPWLTLLVRGRYYSQSGALFWSDDYTGGEPINGPRGQYWTGDRELSPLKNYLLGGRVLADWRGVPGDRVIGAFLRLSLSAGVDFMKTNLESFTWRGEEPDDTFALIGVVNIGAAF